MRTRRRQRIRYLLLFIAIRSPRTLRPTRFRTMGRAVDSPMRRASGTNRLRRRRVAQKPMTRTWQVFIRPSTINVSIMTPAYGATLMQQITVRQ
jgi:hypothetical protein